MSFYIQVINEFESLFNQINDKWFNSQLPIPIITMQTSQKAYGWFFAESWQDKDKENSEQKSENIKHYNELNLSPEYLTRSLLEICVTICHECCHLFAHITDQQDTSNGNVYHNKVFREIGEAHGLIVEKGAKASNGWGYTVASMPFQHWVENEVTCDMSIFDKYRNPPKKAKKPIKPIVTYSCPECEKKAKGDEGIFILCKECGKLMLTKEQRKAIEAGMTEEDILQGLNNSNEDS